MAVEYIWLEGIARRGAGTADSGAAGRRWVEDHEVGSEATGSRTGDEEPIMSVILLTGEDPPGPPCML